MGYNAAEYSDSCEPHGDENNKKNKHEGHVEALAKYYKKL